MTELQARSILNVMHSTAQSITAGIGSRQAPVVMITKQQIMEMKSDTDRQCSQIAIKVVATCIIT